MSGNTTALPRGIVKRTTTDFVVQEIDPSGELVPLLDETAIRRWDGTSPITLFEMTKEGLDTEAARRIIARQLRTSFDCVESTGLKDKRALTSQRIRVEGNYNPFFRHRNIFLRTIGGAERQAKHRGNHFSILVVTDAERITLGNAVQIPNYFGPQRMGAEGSWGIGRYLFEGRNGEAVNAVMASPSRRNLELAAWAGKCSLQEALFHPRFGFSLKFELGKWQSYLWNGLLAEMIRKYGLDGIPRVLPMWSSRPDVVELYRPFWCPPKLGATTWTKNIAKSFLRPTVIRPENLVATRKPEGWELTFDLPPGVYATVLLSQIFDWEEVHH